MDSVLRAAAIYFGLLVLLRLSGRRTLAELTTFDFVLLLIIGEATQQALLGDDYSVTNAFLVIVTLIAIDVGFGLVKARLPAFGRLADGVPMIIVENGVPLSGRMEKARVDVADVLQAAREQGLEGLGQIRYAVLEISGGISIIPKKDG